MPASSPIRGVSARSAACGCRARCWGAGEAEDDDQPHLDVRVGDAAAADPRRWRRVFPTSTRSTPMRRPMACLPCGCRGNTLFTLDGATRQWVDVQQLSCPSGAGSSPSIEIPGEPHAPRPNRRNRDRGGERRTYGGGVVVAFVFGLVQDEVAALGGLVVAIIGLCVQVYYNRRKGSSGGQAARAAQGAAYRGRGRGRMKAKFGRPGPR